MSKYRVTADVDYVNGHLRYGHKELIIEKDVWDKMTKDQQEDAISDGDLIVDDYEVDDYGYIGDIEVEEI